MEQEKIMWKKLKRITEKITKRKVNIHATTSLNNNINAAVEFSKGEVDIAINLNNAKKIIEVIEAISHESAHVVLNSTKHNDEFSKKWLEIRRNILDAYYN